VRILRSENQNPYPDWPWRLSRVQSRRIQTLSNIAGCIPYHRAPLEVASSSALSPRSDGRTGLAKSCGSVRAVMRSGCRSRRMVALLVGFLDLLVWRSANSAGSNHRQIL